MRVQFFEDPDGCQRWCTVDEDEGDIHKSHVGFASRGEAAHNLFINHAMMSIFVSAVARGESEAGAAASGIGFEKQDGEIFWVIRNGNDLLGQSYFGFEDRFSAMDNLIILYTALSVFIATKAQDRMFIKCERG